MEINNQNGFIVGTILVLTLILSILMLTITSTAVSNHSYASKENIRVNAQMAADSGLDDAILRLNLDNNYAGTTGQEEVLNNSSIRTTFETLITDDLSSDRKTIRSTGRTYSPASATTATSTRTYELDVAPVTSGTGPGSVVSGVGGLILNNNSKISGGDVIVNGTVTVNNNAQIGLSTNPINLRVAHQSCPQPVDATYPTVCSSGEPITNNGVIYGDVQAQNQSNSSGMSLPGLTSSSFAPVVVPGYDRPAHKAAVTATYTSSDSAVRCLNNQTITWPADVRINGDVELGENCTVNITGRVWITGNVTFGNNAQIRVADSLGITRTVIMIDGQAGLDTGNNTDITPNSSGTGLEVITTWWNTNTSTNGNFNCGGIPDLLDCSAVTGLALSTSQNITTIDLSNNTDASNTVFRTLWTRAFIANNGALGAVAGQTIQLGNNAVINFTASIAGSDNLIVTWVKRGYIRTQ